MVLRVATGFAARFLAKSTLFRNPISRLVMEAFGSIPIYRAHESGARGGDASRNDASFARCRAELAAGGAMALFPEGVSHSDPQLRPLKTGAARIALSTEAEHDGRLGVTLVPVGLYYERKALFRSSVLLVVGEPIAVAPLLADYRRDERQTVEALTETIDARLDEVVLQAESRDLLAGIARVARWTSDEGSQDLAAQHQRAREMADAYARLRARDPARVESDRRRGPRLHARAAPDGRPRSVGAGARAAAAGRAGGGVREVDRRRAAGRNRRGDGLDSVPAGGRGRQARDARRGRARHREAVRGRRVPGRRVGAGGDRGRLRVGRGLGRAEFLTGVATGYVALRFEELRREAAEAWRLVVLRAFHHQTTQRLAERRRALADAVASGLRDADAADEAHPDRDVAVRPA